MDNYVTLLGTEQVQNAGRTMREAAEQMRQAAGMVDDALHRQRLFMDDWLARFEQVLNSAPAPLSPQRFEKEKP